MNETDEWSFRCYDVTQATDRHQATPSIVAIGSIFDYLTGDLAGVSSQLQEIESCGIGYGEQIMCV
jgi:hypothetical protein